MTARSNPLFLLAAGLLLASASASAQSSAIDWLTRMNQALHALNYEGRFVYRHGDTLEAMYLAHTVRDGDEREHLVSLTGNAREVIRDSNAVICIEPGNSARRIDKRPSGGRFSPIRRIDPDRLSRYYRFDFGGIERVAGREARVVLIAPVDDLRYGYRLVLDTEHQLPLAAATFDKTGRRLTQILFTELKVGTDVTAPPPTLSDQDDVTRTVRPRHPPETQLLPRWSFDDIPAGFEQLTYRRRLVGADDRELEHFVFSDGLASVSVYVEESQGDDGLDGVSTMGAVNAFGRTLKGYHVTAVGEVPSETLSRLVASIRQQVGAP